MLQKALLNAHILYSKKKGKETFKQFQEHVIASLLFPDVEEQLEDVMLPRHAVLTHLTGQHLLSLAEVDIYTRNLLFAQNMVHAKM